MSGQGHREILFKVTESASRFDSTIVERLDADMYSFVNIIQRRFLSSILQKEKIVFSKCLGDGLTIGECF